MKKIVIISLFCILCGTEWTIEAGNMYYSPDYLEIEVGDTVIWDNAGGFHDVYFTSTPNPGMVSFSPCSGPCEIGSYVFNIPGEYDYICSIGNHAQQGMTGTILVVSNDIEGCTDSHAILCEDDLDSLYFPECNTCSDDDPCENYYNSEATIDNGLCMYNDVPTYSEVIITEDSDNMLIDWSAFEPPVEITQYVLMRCADVDGDTDGDGELEHELCVMIIPPMSFYTNTTYVDDFSDVDFGTNDLAGVKYTLSVHYPNNNYWGSAFGYYYYEFDTACEDGEFNNDNPCMPSECFDGVWYDIVIDCAEQMGVPCENGVYIPPPDGVCCSTCALYGDLNFDGIVNVIYVVTMVNGIINSTFDTENFLVADINEDGMINVIDIVSLVNLIIS